MNARSYVGFIIAMVFYAPLSQALESTRLADTIKSNGIGDMNLFTPSSPHRVLNADLLEQFRQNNQGQLVFAVDVNEAANGSEKASSQGVTIQQARLTFTINGVVHTYTSYSTLTKSLLAIKGSTTRTLYHTLIGDAGSSRITNNGTSDINGSSFDATIRFPVDINVSTATAARLYVRFLDTNVSLGDPEAFYDFSNGYEDVAIVTAADAAYLDDIAAGRNEAPLVLPADSYNTSGGGQIYYPSQTTFYIAAYEDLFPQRGDYDFNDLVVGYRVYVDLNTNSAITQIHGEGYLIARGAGYSHDWHLRIPLPSWAQGSGTLSLFAPDATTASTTESIAQLGSLDIIPFSDTRSLWTDDPYETVNTMADQALQHGHRFNFHYTLNQPIPLVEFTGMPFDPYLYVHDTQYEIHFPGKSSVLSYSKNIAQGQTSFVDSSNYPFVLMLHQDWLIPIERIDLGVAYPLFTNYISSGQTANQDWFRTPTTGKTKPLNSQVWKW